VPDKQCPAVSPQGVDRRKDWHRVDSNPIHGIRSNPMYAIGNIAAGEFLRQQLLKLVTVSCLVDRKVNKCRLPGGRERPGGRGGEALEKVNPGKGLTERNRKLCCNPFALCQWCAEPARRVRAVKGRAQPGRPGPAALAVKGSNNTCNQSAESARALKGSNNTQYIHLLENLLLARPINFRGSLNYP
jgi:hypothetical protein